MHDHDDDPPNGGLTIDLPGLLGRRRLLALLGSAAAVALAGCGSDDDSSGSPATSNAVTTTSTSAASTTTGAGAADTTGASSGSDTTGPSGTGAELECSTITQETAGPYPGDGSNGPNVLTDSGAVRSDITSSFGSASGVAEGVPLTINIVVVDTASGCTAMAGAAVYVWHCDRDGQYSLYSQGVTEENYLRGVQETDSNGRATFRSIFPGAYSGRWPHIHFEVYPSLTDATGSDAAITTSQIALPAAACEAVYATSGYEASLRNYPQTPLTRDNVFGDDSGVTQIPTSAGSVENGFSIELTVPV